jgi:hypothetical protein
MEMLRLGHGTLVKFLAGCLEFQMLCFFYLESIMLKVIPASYHFLVKV